MHGRVHDELHLAVDPRARIPARVVWPRVHVDGHHVPLPGFHEIRRVYAERQVAVIPAASFLAVDIYGWHGHHAIKVEIHALARISGGQGERLPIPAFTAPGELAGVRITLRFVGTADGPIVRQPHRQPG